MIIANFSPWNPLVIAILLRISFPMFLFSDLQILRIMSSLWFQHSELGSFLIAIFKVRYLSRSQTHSILLQLLNIAYHFPFTAQFFVSHYVFNRMQNRNWIGLACLRSSVAFFSFFISNSIFFSSNLFIPLAATYFLLSCELFNWFFYRYSFPCTKRI